MKSDTKPTALLSLAGKLRALGQAFITDDLTSRGIHDIIPQHGDIIVTLGLFGPMSMGGLAASVGRKKNTLTTLVQSLERNGYITREATEGDGRVQLVSLTEKGRDIYAVTHDISMQLHEAMWKEVTGAEQETCIAVIRKVIDNLSGNLPGNFSGNEES